MDKQVLVLGLGKTGFSIAKHLYKSNIPFMVYDTRINPPDLHQFKTFFTDVVIYLESYPSDIFEDISKIICSPGVMPNSPFLIDARASGISIESDLDLLSDIIDAPIIGITGSNGKSTVTTLVGEILTAYGLNVAVGGNLGTPVLDLFHLSSGYDAWVLELSSFQLANLHQLKLKAATILNISPDHIDYHGSMQGYINAKRSIYDHAEFLVFNREDELTLPISKNFFGTSFGLSHPHKSEWGIIQTEQGKAIAYEQDVLILTSDLKLKGTHNWLNIMAASALASFMGVNKETIISVLKDFSGLKHRTQWVRDYQDISFINDSKGTNLGASLAAIDGIGPTISGRIILIAGGQGKGADFSPMCSSLKKYVRKVFLIGQDAKILKKTWQDSCETFICESLREAVREAFIAAQSGDVVLLSPACASLDMFKDYQDRGEQFAHLVQELI